MPPKLRFVLALCLLILTGLGLRNVYAEEAGILQLAQAAAEGGLVAQPGTLRAGAPRLQLIRLQRSILAQNFTFQVGIGQTAETRCQRAWIVLGPYSCQLERLQP